MATNQTQIKRLFYFIFLKFLMISDEFFASKELKFSKFLYLFVKLVTKILPQIKRVFCNFFFKFLIISNWFSPAKELKFLFFQISYKISGKNPPQIKRVFF